MFSWSSVTPQGLGLAKTDHFSWNNLHFAQWNIRFCWDMKNVFVLSSVELSRCALAWRSFPSTGTDVRWKWQRRRELRQTLSGIFWHVETFILYACQLFSVWFYLFSFFISCSCCLILDTIILDFLLSFPDDYFIGVNLRFITNRLCLKCFFFLKKKNNRPLTDHIDNKTTLG